MAPNGQIQSEYYGQDISVLLEGSIVRYTPPNNNTGLLDSSKTQAEFYSHISDDKRQDGDTVYENIKFTILDLCNWGMITRDTFTQVMDMVDGCSVQYRCDTVLLHLSCLAFEFGIIYDRAVQPPGHVKCLVDALNGIDKSLLDKTVNMKTAIELSEKKTWTSTRQKWRYIKWMSMGTG